MEIPTSIIERLNPATQNQMFGKPRSEWEEQIDRFYAKLNKKGKPEEFSHARIAGCLATRGIRDAGAAHTFYKKVETEARSFVALFTTLTKPKV